MASSLSVASYVKKMGALPAWAKGRGFPNGIVPKVRRKPRPVGARRANFFDLAQQSEDVGVGHKFYRKHWARYEEPCYYVVTKVKPNSVRPRAAARPRSRQPRTH